MSSEARATGIIMNLMIFPTALLLAIHIKPQSKISVSNLFMKNVGMAAKVTVGLMGQGWNFLVG